MMSEFLNTSDMIEGEMVWCLVLSPNSHSGLAHNVPIWLVAAKQEHHHFNDGNDSVIVFWINF